MSTKSKAYLIVSALLGVVLLSQIEQTKMDQLHNDLISMQLNQTKHYMMQVQQYETLLKIQGAKGQ
jgi:hypothetical protein